MSVTLHLGDCAQVLQTLPAGCIDLTVTSPPYDNLRTYKGYTFDFEPIARELYRVTKPGGVVVWVVGDATINGSETGTSFRQALYFKECGFNLHDTMIYYKRNVPPSVAILQKRYEQCWEYMFVLSKGFPVVCNHLREQKAYMDTREHHQGHRQKNGTFTIADVSTSSTKIKRNVWDYKTGGGHSALNKEAHKHPAIFPEALARDHILSWSNEGDTVLDCFLGSGTTGKMAVKYNRHFIGIEISAEYLAIAERRIKAAQAQPGLFQQTGIGGCP